MEWADHVLGLKVICTATSHSSSQSSAGKR